MLLSHEATGLPCSPSSDTATPKNTVNTMSARICAREITSGKSSTVNVLTICSPMPMFAAASPAASAVPI